MFRDDKSVIMTEENEIVSFANENPFEKELDRG